MADKAYDVLEHLTAQDYKLGIVTTRSRVATGRLLTWFDIYSYFGVVVTRDDCDERKPSPQPLFLAASQPAHSITCLKDIYDLLDSYKN